MLIEVNKITYDKYFPVSPNPYISGPFIELNSGKAEKIVRLIEDEEEPVIGIVAGIKDGILKSPFSAPFGGFHFRKENVYISEIERFTEALKAYLIAGKLKGMELILPPDIYHSSFNAKLINSLIRSGFRFLVPEITNWVDLQKFNDSFSQKNSREYYRQAVRNKLTFCITDNEDDKKEIYDLIYQNRKKFGRPIFMKLEDILATGNLWPADFFKINSDDQVIVASAIFYRSSPEICYAVFWGDNDAGRPLRAMDFLVFNLYSYYKKLGFKYLDLGISTESGSPNEGLLRFKESHEAISSLRYKFIWEE
jgi:hypothetical protein